MYSAYCINAAAGGGAGRSGVTGTLTTVSTFALGADAAAGGGRWRMRRCRCTDDRRLTTIFTPFTCADAAAGGGAGGRAVPALPRVSGPAGAAAGRLPGRTPGCARARSPLVRYERQRLRSNGTIRRASRQLRPAPEPTSRTGPEMSPPRPAAPGHCIRVRPGGHKAPAAALAGPCSVRDPQRCAVTMPAARRLRLGSRRCGVGAA